VPIPVLWFFLLHSVVWQCGFWAYLRWVRRPGGYSPKSIVGIAMAYGFLVSETFPFLGFLRESRRTVGPDMHAWPTVCFLAIIGALLLAGVVCFGSRLISQKGLGACPTERDPVTPRETLECIRRAREELISLQINFCESVGRVVPLSLTESLAEPRLVGLNPSRIYVPVPFAVAGIQMKTILEPLVAFAGSWRYRAYMFLWWLAQFHVMLQPLVSGIRRALECEISRAARKDRKSVGYRLGLGAVDQRAGPIGVAILDGAADSCSTGGPGHRKPWAFVPVFGALALSGWGAWYTGGFQFQDLAWVFSDRAIVGSSTHAYHPAVRFRAVPGKGGILPDGLMVDTTQDAGSAGCTTVRLPLGLVESERQIPFGTNAIRVHLEWKTLQRTGSAHDTPAVKIACAEQSRMDPEGQQRLHVFFSRHFIIPGKEWQQGALDLALQLHPRFRQDRESTDVIYGPVIYIPKGWEICWTNYSIDPIPVEQVDAVPVEEAAEFISWYAKNGSRPAHPDFRWRKVPTWVSFHGMERNQ